MRSIYRPASVVDAWFDLMPARQVAHATRLLILLAEESPDLIPAVKWGALVLLRGSHHAFAIAPFRPAVHFQVFNGGSLGPAYGSRLGGHGPGMRAIRVRYSQPIDEAWVRQVIRAANEAAARKEAAAGTGERQRRSS
ncbi:MAG: DUF1801 domain-containing protein [Aquabacterium sp.]